MAYETYVDSGASPTFQHPYDQPAKPRSNYLYLLTNLTAAAMSLALVAGVGVWAYKLVMRDVTGIPIVRAAEGEMRVRPADPGGQLAEHQGLAVNMVAAEGGAEAPAERLVLAPQPVKLTEEDVPMDAEAVAIVQQAIADQAALPADEPEAHQPVTQDAQRIEEAAKAGDMTELVAALTDGVTPLEAAKPAAEAKIIKAAIGASELLSRDVPGVKASLRPQVRPDRDTAMLIAASVQVAGVKPEAVIDPASLPSGTRLVQLGAFDSEDLARKAWSGMTGRFRDLMAEKSRVVQQASSGGRTFYRLRAHGFEDLADARRFCSALVAEGADCIPVVTR